MTIFEANQLLYALTKGNADRIAVAKADRLRLIELINKGVKPTGYRADYLRSSSIKIINLLNELGKEFDEIYVNDKMLVSDLLDILSTAKKRLEDANEMKKRGFNDT
jgi:hypothetical protein